MKYAICLHSRYDGRIVWLGSKYDTREKAQEAANRDVCLRCNRYEIYMIDDDAEWENKTTGFTRRATDVGSVVRARTGGLRSRIDPTRREANRLERASADPAAEGDRP